MPSTRPLPEQFGALVSRCQVRGKLRGEILALFVRGCRQRGLASSQLAICRSLVRGLELCRPRRLAAWEDLDAMRAEVQGRMALRSDEKLFSNGLSITAGQLVLEGVLPPRLRHRQRALCRGCHRMRLIENVQRQLCAACVGEATLQDRFDRLCRRQSFADAAKAEILDALLAYERRQPATVYAWQRVWALSGFLAETASVPALRTWAEVRQLRKAIQQDRLPGRAHKAQWALYKVCEVLIERGVLDARPPKTTGPLSEQLEAIATYFYVEDPYRQGLLRRLIDHYHGTRVTITAVQVVQALAYYLARTDLPVIESWLDIHELICRSPDPPERWHRRIKTALRRLGDALQRQGVITAHPDRDAVERLVARLDTTDSRLHDVNVRFITSLHEHGRRPNTLRAYIMQLNRFWTWLATQAVQHPAQVSAELVLGYLRAVDGSGASRSQLGQSRTCLRGYFDWLCRQRLVLSNPVPPPRAPGRTIVRVCETETFERLVAALGEGRLAARDALTVYLLVFHGLRNHEVVRAVGVGFRGHGPDATFTIELPELIASAGHYKPSRRDRIVRLPTGRYPWLYDAVVQVTDERARILKEPSNPYLLVSPSWRQGTRPMGIHTVNDAVARASMRVCGVVLTPAVVRQTAATYFADRSDHTVCSAMGWGTSRAVELAYATREIVARAPEQ